MWCLPLISYREFVSCIWFSAVIVSGQRDLPSDTRTFIAARKAHQSSARRRYVKDQKTCLEAIIQIKSRATCRPKKRCKANLSTVSVLANRSLHQDLMLSGCCGTTASDVCVTFFVSPCDFLTLSPNRDTFHGLGKTWTFLYNFSFLKRSFTDISPCLLR